jgi:predicted N-formylglutamate amidohydrolase
VQQDPSHVETVRRVRSRHLRREVIKRGHRGDRLATALAGLLVAGHQLAWVVELRQDLLADAGAQATWTVWLEAMLRRLADHVDDGRI